MTMLWEKVVVTAKSFLETNINDSREFNEILTKTKLNQFNWDPQFTAAPTFVEIVWKMAIGRESQRLWQQLDRLFSPSAIATHANFRGSRDWKTGNLPQKGAIVVWRMGITWRGDIGIVTDVYDNNKGFDVIQGSLLQGSSEVFLQVVERKGKRVGLDFRQDKSNLLGFIYPPDREIA